MNRRDPTIYQVAETAGVSIATVSRVLNAPHRVNENTRKRVLKAIEELHFVPKAEASARARKDFKRIGVLTPYFTEPSFVQRMRGISNVLMGSEYELIVYAVESLVQLRGYLDMLPISRRIDGLIVMSLPLANGDAERIRSNHLQTVLVEYNHPFFSSIEIDNENGGRLAAEYLLGKGYRRMAFIGEAGEPPYSLHPSAYRLTGFQKILSESGTPLSDEYIGLNPLDMRKVRQQTNRFLDLPEPPEAIFACSDIQAAGVLRAARERGLRIPDDLAVLGFDNIDLADYMELTTIDQALDESGRTAVELLIARMANPERPPQNIKLQLSVIERSTV
jgi:DNA-binding LacI/PurR family transcriptional regulator